MVQHSIKGGFFVLDQDKALRSKEGFHCIHGITMFIKINQNQVFSD